MRVCKEIFSFFLSMSTLEIFIEHMLIYILLLHIFAIIYCHFSQSAAVHMSLLLSAMVSCCQLHRPQRLPGAAAAARLG